MVSKTQNACEAAHRRFALLGVKAGNSEIEGPGSSTQLDDLLHDVMGGIRSRHGAGVLAHGSKTFGICE